MKVKYLTTLSYLLTGTLVHATDFVPTNPGAAPQQLSASYGSNPYSAPVANPAVQPQMQMPNTYVPPVALAAPTAPTALAAPVMPVVPVAPVMPVAPVPYYSAPTFDPSSTNLPAQPRPQVLIGQHRQNRHKSTARQLKNASSTNQATRRNDEKQLIGMAENIINHSSMPTIGQEGSIVFPFGSSMPKLVCTELQLCVVKLQPGEVISQVDIGDAARWRVTPSVSGSGANATPYLVVKTTDKGIRTNMLVATNYRYYKIELISSENGAWTPEISFTYPEDPLVAWADYVKVNSDREKAAAAALAVAQDSTSAGTPAPHAVALPKIHFKYKIEFEDDDDDKPIWLPERVYSDGIKTYIEFPEAVCADEIPALLSLDDSDDEQLVNYRMIDKHRYMVDKVLRKAILVIGVDDKQTRVTIERED